MTFRLFPSNAREWLQNRIAQITRPVSRFDTTDYWESRYASGGTSGEGSYGRLAAFKARLINDFVVEHDVKTAIEFGCGDGNQLSLLRIPKYVGLDVSRTAVKRCVERFRADATKSFFLFDSRCFRDASGLFVADLALSLDVIFHLVEDEEFESYMRCVCASCRKHLILYTTDYDLTLGRHERHRRVSPWMQNNEEFTLLQNIPNPHAGSRDNHQESDARFLIYQRTQV